jgi:hypothetical protein
MIPVHYSQSSKPLSGRYLAFAEREEIAILRVQEQGVRAIARKLGRAPSTISRELRRNAATRGGGLKYRATTAQWHADRSRRRPKPAKLVEHKVLRRYMQERLAGAVTAPDGVKITGPKVAWKGRRFGPRQHRRWTSLLATVDPETVSLAVDLGQGSTWPVKGLNRTASLRL